MTIIVDEKNCSIFPVSVRRRAGIKTGSELEVKVNGGIVSFIPKLPAADDEYTPEQRRAIKAEIAAARLGPYHGPFRSGEELAAYLKTYKRRRSKAAKTKQ
ncbi:MAG: hypothetical protein HYZ37_03215 [Candidatus Solibacter usitatus]|nr:hypothetical protein [Candidatus Solibacter usitatus]